MGSYWKALKLFNKKDTLGKSPRAGERTSENQTDGGGMLSLISTSPPPPQPPPPAPEKAVGCRNTVPYLSHRQDQLAWQPSSLSFADYGTGICSVVCKFSSFVVCFACSPAWCSVVAYQYDLETKQQSAVWVFPDENPPVKFKRNRSASKQMMACFFAKLGHVTTIPLEDRKTVTADLHVNHCLPKVFQAWYKWRPRTGACGLLLHQDNDPCDWFFPFHQKAAEGKAVSERRRCPSILRGRHFGHTPVNVVGCQRQLVWEDGQMCTGWGGFLRKAGVDSGLWVLLENQAAKHNTLNQ